MSTRNTQVKNLDAYEDGFNKGIDLVEKHKKLISASASFIKSLMYKDYNSSYSKGVADGWDYGFRKKKEILQEQARKRFEERQQQEATARENNAEQSPEPTTKVEVDPRMQQRMAQMRQQREGERGRDDQELDR